MNIVKQAVEGATSLAKPINEAQETGWEGKGMKRMTHEPLLHANRHIRLVDKQVHTTLLAFKMFINILYI